MKTPVLLVAEDNDLDAMLLERLLERCGSVFKMIRVEHGDAVVDYLLGTGSFGDRTIHPPADLILLDLKMPRRDGFGVLRWRQENPAFNRVPIIVFSSSDLPSDVAKAYSLGANSYLVKPSAPERLERMVRALNEWWAEFNVTAPHA